MSTTLPAQVPSSAPCASRGDDIQIEYAENVPNDLPSLDDIVITCLGADFRKHGIRINVNGEPRFWAKFGTCDQIRKGNGLTQAYVSKIVNADSKIIVRVPEVYVIFRWRANPSRRFIVMQFVKGTTFAERKLANGKYSREVVQPAADAVKRLLEIRMPPDTAPGPIGGGRIYHGMFVESISDLVYLTVEALEKQINKVVRLAGPLERPVDFKKETEGGLVLCLSDLDENDFMIDDTKQLWLIDFSRASFLPPSFIYYSLRQMSTHFGRCVAYLVGYEEGSQNFRTMGIVAGQFIINGSNSLCVVAQRPPSCQKEPANRQQSFG